MNNAPALSFTEQQWMMAIGNPGSLGTIDAYVQAVQRIPLLSSEEELRLGKSLRLDNDLDAAKQLILSHLRLVVSVTRQYLGYGLPHADLIQEGNIGLMKAVKRFDETRGVRLVSFAMHWIKAEIHEYVIRNWRQVKIATTKAQRKLFFNLRSMKEGQEQLSLDQIDHIASTLSVKPSEVIEMEKRLSNHDVALEKDHEDDEHTAPIGYLIDMHDEPTQVIERNSRHATESIFLPAALNQLDERSQAIVQARWLDDEPKTLHELADVYGVSAERIRQIESAALKKLKLTLAPQQLQR